MNNLESLFINAPLFKDLEENQIHQILSLGDELTYESGKIIVHQGDVGDDFFLICSGKVEVLKEKDSGAFHQVAILNPGATLGEMSVIDQGYRSATVRVVEKTKVLRVRGIDFRRISKEDPEIGRITFQNLARDLGSRLRQTNEVTVVALEKNLAQTKKQVVVGNFMVSVLIILTLFTFSLGIMTQLTHALGTSGYVTVGLLLLTTFMMVNLMVQSGYELSFYGITLKNWRHSVGEAVAWSFVALILTTAIKFIIITQVPQFHNEPLFNIKGAIYRPDSDGSTLLWLAVLYVFVSSPLQEFLFRGCFQGTLRSFLLSHRSGAISVLTTSLIFSMVHLMISPILALVSFSGGVLWGVLYNRHGTLIGVTVSHILIGAWLFFVLGIENMIVGKI